MQELYWTLELGKKFGAPQSNREVPLDVCDPATLQAGEECVLR